ncbi:hypothetical protein EX895_004763 [Sporisorium graminicola]|uniref:Uncharacterized protein n=1 Tax=Sporisorium graminicola TaxID=280036 RepID=A0A4U7KRT4_9BASI|nr:hypothetical protein EX895_004763 [Sporisorium graminicola]TKY85938.1 hypothetical protein EX895_004763 [Sporisorium graminicola]
MVVIHPPRFLGASSRLPGTYDITDTGFYVALSVVVSSHATQAIGRHGIKGYAGAWRVGAVAFCLASWVGIWRSGTPLLVDTARSDWDADVRNAF